MKVLIICSGKADMAWKKRYNSVDFNEALRLAQDYDIESVKCEQISSNTRPVYVSSAKGALQTVEQIFTDAAIVKEELLDEVSLRSYKDTEKELPLRFWQLTASLQRSLGSSRQPESKSQARARAKRLLDLLESRNQDCILVSHPIFINILLSQFRKRGYHINRRNYFRIVPLERIVITKWDMHCGGCGHNCLLTNPGCGVGRDAARRRGVD